jgi:hypothetical protein
VILCGTVPEACATWVTVRCRHAGVAGQDAARVPGSVPPAWDGATGVVWIAGGCLGGGSKRGGVTRATRCYVLGSRKAVFRLLSEGGFPLLRVRRRSHLGIRCVMPPVCMVTASWSAVTSMAAPEGNALDSRGQQDAIDLNRFRPIARRGYPFAEGSEFRLSYRERPRDLIEFE